MRIENAPYTVRMVSQLHAAKITAGVSWAMLLQGRARKDLRSCIQFSRLGKASADNIE